MGFISLTINPQYKRPQAIHFKGSRREISAERNLCAFRNTAPIKGTVTGAKFKFGKLKCALEETSLVFYWFYFIYVRA